VHGQLHTFLAAAGAIVKAAPRGGDALELLRHLQQAGAGAAAKVRKAPSWPRSWASFSLLSLYFHGNAWASLQFLGRPDTLLARRAARLRRWSAS
jgi:hypothetical protein